MDSSDEASRQFVCLFEGFAVFALSACLRFFAASAEHSFSSSSWGNRREHCAFTLDCVSLTELGDSKSLSFPGGEESYPVVLGIRTFVFHFEIRIYNLGHIGWTNIGKVKSDIDMAWV